MTRVGLAAASLMLCIATLACGGSGVQGEYLGEGAGTFFNSLTFRSDGKVDIVFVGLKQEGSYEVADGAVTMTAPNGDKVLLRPDDNGCLTNSLIGTYCRNRSARTVERSVTGRQGDARAAGSSDAPDPDVYEARAREGQIRLELGAARKARITMVPTGIADAPERMSFDVSYVTDGGAITIDLPGNEPLTLTRAGRDLEGTMNGETVRFVKR